MTVDPEFVARAVAQYERANPAPNAAQAVATTGQHMVVGHCVPLTGCAPGFVGGSVVRHDDANAVTAPLTPKALGYVEPGPTAGGAARQQEAAQSPTGLVYDRRGRLCIIAANARHAASIGHQWGFPNKDLIDEGRCIIWPGKNMAGFRFHTILITEAAQQERRWGPPAVKRWFRDMVDARRTLSGHSIDL